MQIYRELPATPLSHDTTLTIGVFDGVHLGHQALIGEAVRRARDSHRLCGVLTFDPHPVEVLAPNAHIRYLTTIDARAQLIEQLGADFLYIIHFSHAVSQLSAREFVRPLVEKFRMRDLVIGYDFTLGHNRQGNADYLRALGDEWGFTLEVVPPVMVGGEIVSSTRIRKLLSAGKHDEAEQLLAHSSLATLPYEEISHTADVALRVHGRTLESLFVNAARGMFALMTDSSQIATESEFSIEVDAPDHESLLVNWLNELLFQHEMSEQMFCDFDVSITSEGHLRGTVRGGTAHAEIRKHIKAVTFHDLRIVEHGGMFETTLVFDI